ncbi:hypothetical protein [Thermodesulfobacterium geofontis]|jgi:hypothetical protein|uniref:hypothetical protein n=1 Tax=Thermodesulfobacterium geofontis TaxID=1295609 RepID=UPI00059D32F7|nr:hypothetical protein [Thermodesulfobacterium geofontis]
MILILDGRFEEKHLKQKVWKTLKICKESYHSFMVVSNFNGTPLTEKRLLWLLNKTFLPLLYRISDFRVKNLDEKLLKVLMDAIDIIQRVLELGCELL